MSNPYGPNPTPPGGSPSVPAGEQMLLSIGDIGVYRDRVVTPSGTFPMQSLTWVVRDNTLTTQEMPAYAIVLAIVFFPFCLLGLLFLLIKETKTQGYVEASVQGAGAYHVTQIPISQAAQIAAIRQQVDYARSLAVGRTVQSAANPTVSPPPPPPLPLAPAGPAPHASPVGPPASVRRDAGWYPDPADRSLLRWWDGDRWTDATHPAS